MTGWFEIAKSVSEPAEQIVTLMAVIFGGIVAAWKFIRPNCRLEPVSQGRDWHRFFQLGAPWQLKVRVINKGGPIEKLQVRIDRIEALDFNDRVIVARSPEPIQLAPLRTPIFWEGHVTVGGVGRSETAELQVHRIRVRGRLIAANGLRLSAGRRFSFVMNEGSSFDGRMTEGSW